MKRIAAIMGGLFLMAPVALAGSQDFTLVNGSASNICYVYISPQSSNQWEEDILGADECLAPGESIDIEFDAGNQAIWDLRVEDENGNYEDYRGFDLNKISEIVLKGGGKAQYR